jgi:hypothetical protein
LLYNVPRDHAIVIEANPLCLLIEPITHWDVEIADLPVVEYEAGRRMVEGIFIMEDVLLQVVEAILVGFLGNGSVGFAIGNGLVSLPMQ